MYPPASLYSDNTSRESITPNPNHMSPSRKKTPTLFPLPQFTPTPYCHNKTESVPGTTRSPMENGITNAKNPMSPTRKWKSKRMRIRLNKTNLRVRRTTLFEYIGFTTPLPQSGNPISCTSAGDHAYWPFTLYKPSPRSHR